MSNWVTYENGNYNVRIDLDTGTKIRYNDLDFFEPTHPESLDLKITNACDMGCPMCHENSTPNGAHGDILNTPFLDTFKPYTELALGGGNALSHPDLDAFLQMCKKRNLICNMTVNQVHFTQNIDRLKRLIDEKLIYGLGVSLNGRTDSQFIDNLKLFPNAVIHTINGIVTMPELDDLAGNGFKLLILGYKDFRRGVQYRAAMNEHITALQNDLKRYLFSTIIRDGWFKVVSFDNLAIEQLDVKSQLSEEKWKQMYMGGEGSHTMYVDMVNREFAESSVATERYPITDDIAEMFAKVRSNRHGTD